MNAARLLSLDGGLRQRRAAVIHPDEGTALKEEPGTLPQFDMGLDEFMRS
jgi:hypothetical protein